MILLFCRDLWDFISAVAGSINQISEAMSRHSERTMSLLKAPPDFR